MTFCTLGAYFTSNFTSKILVTLLVKFVLLVNHLLVNLVELPILVQRLLVALLVTLLVKFALLLVNYYASEATLLLDSHV